MILHESDVALPFPAPRFSEAETLTLFLVFLLQILPCHERGMDIVEGVVGKERLVAVRLHELPRLRREAVGEMFAFGTVAETRIAVGGKILFASVGPAAVDAAHVDVEALILGPPAFGTEMPLARKEGCITALLHRLSQRRCIERETIGVGRGEQLRVALPLVRLGRRTDVVGDPEPLRPLPRHDARPGR